MNTSGIRTVKNLLQVGDDLVFEPLVETGEGLVQEDQPRAGQQGTAESDPLTFASGEAGDPAAEQGRQVERLDQRRGFDPAFGGERPYP